MFDGYSPHSWLASITARRLAAGLLTITLAIALLPAAPEPAAAETVFEFQGGGYGHSVGMSQFGAYGMALQGHSAEAILTHYYTGTTVEDVDPVVSAVPLWVNLSQQVGRLSLTTRATGDGPAVPVVYTQDGATAAAAPGETATIERLGDGRCRVQTPHGTLTGSCAIDAEWDGWDASPTTAVILDGCSLPNWNDPAGTVYQPCTYAHGGLRIRPDDDSNTVHLAVEIGIEPYVLGISESPYFWGSTGGMEALRAQAVAARTYALRKAYERGDPAARPWCACNLYDSTVDQFYVGWGHLTPEWTEAVTSTEGKVVTHPSTLQNGVQLPIQAFYSSSTFGWTEHSEHGFTAYVPYLRGVDDHWSQLPEVGNHSARWVVELTGPQLAERLPGLTTVTGIDVAACSPSGAILELTFRGEGGPRTFRTSELRTRLGIKSMQVFNVGAPPPETPPCTGPGIDPLPVGGPVSVAGIHVDDDGNGDSLGDGDGIAEPGEVVELLVTLRNDGDSLTGIEAGLTSTSPDVVVQWNVNSGYPGLAPGGTAENQDDWDLAVGQDAAGVITLQLTVTAANGGPWTLQVALPVGTSVEVPGTRATSITAIGDVGGGPAEDIAVTYVAPGGAPRLRVLDPLTGTTISDVQIGARGTTVADAARVPERPEVAILLVTEASPAVVRIHDALTGARIGTRRFGGARPITWSHLVVIPGGAPDGGTSLGVFGIAEAGGQRVAVKSADTPEVISNIRVGRHTEVADLGQVGDLTGDGVTDVVVVGRRSFGSDLVLVFDPTTGAQFRTAPLSGKDQAALFASLPDGRLTVVSSRDDTRAYVTAVDPATGAREPDVLLELWQPAAVVWLPSGTGIAVLGRSQDGTPTAVVIDPATGAIVTTTRLPEGTPVDLAAPAGERADSPVLAGLIASEHAVTVEVREAFTGTPVRSIPIS